MKTSVNLCDIAIFGGHGDLAFRKLMPALYNLFQAGNLDEKSRIITVSRRELSNDEHLALIESKLQEFLEERFDATVFESFKEQLYIATVDFSDEKSFETLQKLYCEYSDRPRINYLSTSPKYFGAICHALDYWKLNSEDSRVVLEKPIGKDLASSRVINQEVLKYFKENQIYRIDHYLGKETVQNIMALRFSNRLFVPLWNSNHIDHVQITAAESVGVEGRWGYYDEYGAMRDMIQNHLMQLLCLVAMEPPCSLDPNSVRDEKVKVLRSLRPMNAHDIAQKTVRAQYLEGSSKGEPVKGYLQEGGVEDSSTETFSAMRVDIDNWRWNGVPFYIRSGKRMQKKNSEIVIQFKSIPHSIFGQDEAISQNKLVISLQPKESIVLKMMNKVAGLDANMKLQEVDLELNSNGKKEKFEAYERLLLDIIRGNPTLFMRLDEVELAWKWTEKIIHGWEDNLTAMKSYSAGSDGPTASVQLIAQDGRSWYDE